uniref:Tyrosine-protein phosphatase domain-containing protein n=1 Tax=Parastrongyloides trichosuri TaxID=131310 RepID=A0A0N4ZIE8_PARTI
MDCKEIKATTNTEEKKYESQKCEKSLSENNQEQDIVPRKIPCLNSEEDDSKKMNEPDSTNKLPSQTYQPNLILSDEVNCGESKPVENNYKVDSTSVDNLVTPEEDSKEKDEESNICEDLAKAMVEKGVDGILTEFYSLNHDFEESDFALFFNFGNMSRNRYRDIVLKDATRIILEDEENDYIHANYVSTPSNSKRFICCQAPLESTTEHFWKMILQEDTEYIFMLCHFIEEGRSKCHPYYPEVVGEKLIINNLTIENVELEDHPTEHDLRVCVLNIYDGDKLKKTVKHWQYVSWPDKKVPLLSETIFYALDNMRCSQTPIVVHCSAGIGRTGTVVFLENLLEKIKNGDIVNETPARILESIRKQRAMSVQTPMQYLYTHRLLLSYLLRKGKIQETPGLTKFFQEYDDEYKDH